MEFNSDHRSTLNSWTKPALVTKYIKNNTRGLEALLNYDIDCSSFITHKGCRAVKEPLGAALQYIADKIYKIVVEDDIIENISKHLLNGISLTATEKETIRAPIFDFEKSMKCFYCEVMRKLKYSYRLPDSCACEI